MNKSICMSMRRFVFFQHLFLVAIFSGGVFLSPIALAQSVDEISPLADTVLGDVSKRGSGLAGAPAGNAKCFDYYTFGSAVVNIASIINDALPGTDMTFSGSIANENAYPLVGLDLYVKIFRKQADDPDVQLNGHHLVAQFVAVKGLHIDAKGEQKFSFQWPVPAGTIPGDYMLATYAMTNEAYNLSGLSFTNDVTGSTAPFVIGGQPVDTFAWDKNAVAMNRNPFHFAAYIPQFPKDEPVTVTAPFVNQTSEDRTIDLTWKQYSWDGLRESALVDTKVERVLILAGQTKELAFVATKYTGSVTYIVADAEYQGTHSILDMRFARTGVEQARINFPSLTTFPLVAGQPTAMFSCLHVVGPDTLGGGKLDLVVTDKDGAIIASDTYEGSITGAMMGVKYDFVPQKDYDTAILTATLSRDGVIEDSGTVTYDCQDINPAKCAPKEAVSTAKDPKMPVSALGMVAGIVLLSAIVAAALYFRKKKISPPPLALFIWAVLSGVVFGGSPFAVRADTTSWTSGTMSGYEMLAHPRCDANCTDPDGYPWGNHGPISPTDSTLYRNSGNMIEGKWLFEIYPVARFDGISATVRYNVDAKKSGSKLTNGSSVLKVGDTITFDPVFSGTDIDWVGTGSFNDSPYGQWGVTGNPGCTVANRVASDYGDALYGDNFVYASLQIPQPTVSLTSLSNLSCVGLSCTVTGSGTVRATVSYAATSGQMYGATSRTKNPSGSGVYYDTGCTYVSTPIVDYAKSDAYPSCVGVETEDKEVACFNNASNMKLSINVPVKTIPFSFTAVNPSLTMTGGKHVALGDSPWERALASIWSRFFGTARASGAAVSIIVGDSVDLNWTSTDVDSCSLAVPSKSPYVVPSGSIASGTRNVTGLPVGAGQVLTMTCTNSSTGASVSDSVTVNVSAANELRICPPTLTMSAGSNYQMRAFYLIGGVDCDSPGVAAEVSNAVTWTSSDTSIATVGNNPTGGRVNAISPGTTNMTISSYAGKTASAAVVTVTAATYTITSSAGTGGTIAPNGTTSKASGSSQAYTISANTGYVINDVLVDSVSVGAVSSYTFSNITANHTISASFTRSNPVITFNGNGADSGTMSAQTVTYGVATPIKTNIFTRTGYRFNGWNTLADGTGTSYSDGANITLTSNTTLYAKWTPLLQISGLSVSPRTCGNYGLDVAWSLVIGATGYKISRDGGTWTDKGNINSFYDNPPFGAGTTHTYRVQAYAPGPLNGPIFPPNVDPAVSGIVASACGTPTYSIAASAGTGGTIAPNGTTSNIMSGSSQAYTISANTGYVINDVLVDSVSVGAVSSYTFSNITANHTISASFVAANELRICPPALTMTASTNYQMRAFYLIGGVDCDNPGTALDVSNAVNWTSSAPSIATVGDNPAGGRVNAISPGTTNMTISSYAGKTAPAAVVTVIAGATYSIVASAGTGGTIAPNGTTSNIVSGGSQAYTIAANMGYVINDVLVDSISVGAVPSYTFSNITANHTISASFVAGASGVCGVVYVDSCSAGTYVDAADTEDYYHWTCEPIVSDGNCYMAKPKINICPDSGVVAVGGTLQLRSYYTPLGTLWSGSCSSPNGTDVANATESRWYQFSLAPNTSVTSPGGLVTGLVPGGEVIQTFYDPPGGGTGYGSVEDQNWNITVVCLPYITCSTSPHDATAANTCPDKSFTIDDGCGGTVTCNGTRTCDFNWKEVGQ